ncbi:MAG: replicative DNA helicase [Candidatus Saccharibacteria bacterium]|nr:replicative DNA helicase [Candidatus Saccharibacteria bacterium]
MNSQSKNCDVSVEQALLGSILLNPNAILQVVDILKEEDFSESKHQTIYSAIAKVYQSDNAIDIVTVGSQLKSDKKFKAIGSNDYLNALINIVPTSAHIKSYTDIVIKKSIQRSILTLSKDLRVDEEPDKVLTNVINRLGKLASRTSRIDDKLIAPPDIKEIFAKTSKGIQFSFKGLDAKALINRAAITVIKGKSKNGKTTFMQNVAKNVINQQHNAYFFSYEMSYSELFCRFLMMFGGKKGVFASHNHLEQVRTLVRNHSSGKQYSEYAGELDMVSSGEILSNPEIEYLLKIYDQLLKKLKNRQLVILDTPHDINSLCQQLQYIAENDDQPVIFIDYIQKIPIDEEFGTRQLELQKISAKLLASAVQLNIPIILSSQVNKSDGGTREAMDIEQDANTIIELTKQEDEDIIKCSVAKNRNGKEGKAGNLELEGGAFLLC